MKIETIILAGGQSSRMGEDKALLTVKGKAFLTHIYEQVIQFSEQVYIVTPWKKKYLNLVPNHCQFINESTPFQGPLFAFAEALPYIKTEWVLLLACDLPYLNVAMMKTWLEQLTQIPPDAIAFLAANNKGWECLCGFYRTTCLQSLQQYLKSGKQSFQGWLKQEKVVSIVVENQNIFFNCNTPTDYLKIQESDSC